MYIHTYTFYVFLISSDLANILVRDQDVSGCQIAVNKPLVREIEHAQCHLCTVAQQQWEYVPVITTRMPAFREKSLVYLIVSR